MWSHISPIALHFVRCCSLCLKMDFQSCSVHLPLLPLTGGSNHSLCSEMHMQKRRHFTSHFPLCVPQMVLTAEFRNSSPIMWWVISAWFSACESWKVWDLASRYSSHLSQDYCVSSQAFNFPSQWKCLNSVFTLRDSEVQCLEILLVMHWNLLKVNSDVMEHDRYSSWKSLVGFVS